MKRLPLIALTAVILLGCATAAQQEASRIQSLAQDGFEKYKACRAPIDANPKYEHLYEKIAIGMGRMPSSNQLSDNEKITDEDIAAGLDHYAEIQQCDRATLEWLGKIDPELVIIVTNSIQEHTKLVTRLVKEKTHPTYGTINKEVEKFKIDQQVAVKQWAQQLKARLQTQHQQEIQEREAAIGSVTEGLAKLALAAVGALAHQQIILAQAQTNYVEAYPAYVPVSNITITHCQWIGRFWMCTQNNL